MNEKPKAKPKEDDPKQSEAFRKAVRDLEAAGDLDHEKGDAAPADWRGKRRQR